MNIEAAVNNIEANEGKKTQVAIIGCGNMGSAIAKGLASQLAINTYDHTYEKAAALPNVNPCQDLTQAIKDVPVVFLLVKPQSFVAVASEIAPHINNKQIIVSFLTGISLETIKVQFPNNPIVRCMPNIACEFAQGVIGLCSDSPSKETLNLIDTILSPLGHIHWINEKQMNALTSLTGSGPAFALLIIESMVDAAVAMGFSANEGLSLVIEMLSGTLHLLEQSKLHPAALKWQITSPAGTTIAGIIAAEDNALRKAIIHTFLAARDRSSQIGKS